jgi:molybdopterin/thiamine biosynthesis adenylyltransferase
MLGAGIGKIWIADDWDSDETNLAIQKMFEGEDDDLLCPEPKGK